MKRPRRKIPVVLRLDDPSPGSNHALEARVLEILRSHGASLTVAIVPFSSTKDGCLELRAGDALRHIEAAVAEGFVEVALHGCHHLENSRACWGPSEFYGLPYDQQHALMSNGLARLGAVFPGPIAGFVPPWNTFDVITMQVASDLGFKYISADWLVPPESRALPMLIPKTCYLGTLRDAVARARLYRIVSPAIVTIFHLYDFVESGAPGARLSLADFDRLVGWIKSQDDLEVVDLKTLSTQLEARRMHDMLLRADRAAKFHYRLARVWPMQFIHAGALPTQLAALALGGMRAMVGRSY